MFSKESHKTGALNEIKAQVQFMKMDYDIFTPIHPRTRADFIAIKGLETLRVQVKTAQYNGKYIQSRLDVHDRRYTEEDCDVIVFILDERMWIAPIEEVSGMSSVCLGKIESDGVRTYRPQKEYDPSKWEVH